MRLDRFTFPSFFGGVCRGFATSDGSCPSEAGVTHIFMPNIDSTTIGPMLRVCREYKGYCFPMIGLHPTSVDADYEKELEIVARELA